MPGPVLLTTTTFFFFLNNNIDFASAKIAFLLLLAHEQITNEQTNKTNRIDERISYSFDYDRRYKYDESSVVIYCYCLLFMNSNI